MRTEQMRITTAAQLLATWLLMTLVFTGVARAQGTDTDFDGIPDSADNCVLVPNQGQHDDDQDLYGDVCDPDLNNDGLVDALDIAEWKRLMGTGDLEPDLSGDGQVDYRDLGLLNAAQGTAPGPRGLTPAEINPPYLISNANVEPVATHINAFPDWDLGPRPLARIEALTSEGVAMDFVANEILLFSTNPQDAADLVARRGGLILGELDLAEKFGPGTPSMYIISVDASGTDTSTLNADLATIDPRIHGGYGVSDSAGAELLALVIDEQTHFGLDVSLNAIANSDLISRRSTTEAAETMGAADQPGGEPYTPNIFEWKSHMVEPDVDPGDSLHPVDTGVGEAWRILGQAGMLSRRSRAMIWDGGFFPNADFPPFTMEGDERVPNPDPTDCGSSDGPSQTCQAHGTHTVLSGFGLPDNEFGTAGPGGPVTDLTLLASPSMDVGIMVGFIFDRLPSALASRPDVINISASFPIDAGWCALFCHPLERIVQVITSSGIMLVASAGNEGVDVDKEDTFCIGSACIPFEGSTAVPCELDGVICVGATEYERSQKADFSNWGSKNDANSVDIYAPGELWSVNAQNADSENPSPDDDLQIITGTSFSAPFVSGVATLVHAAQPGLNGNRIADCILSTAHTTSLSATVRRRVNALDAVRCARGNRSHPFVEIPDTLEGQTFDAVLDRINVAAHADDAEDGEDLTIEWYSSDRAWRIATSEPGEVIDLAPIGFPVGSYVLTAGVVDSHGFIARDRVRIEITNPPPTIEMLSPRSGRIYDASQTLTLLASTSDPNGTPNFGPIDESQLTWTVYGEHIATGNNIEIPASSLEIGGQTLCVHGTDEGGATESACQFIIIEEEAPHALPDVQIITPTNYSVINYPNGPVEVELTWTAEDFEGNPIPFSQTEIFYRSTTSQTEPSSLTNVTGDVRVQNTCTQWRFVIGSGPICIASTTQYFLEISGYPGANTSYAFIRVRATDSEGIQGEDTHRVTINEFN
ncbi:MAG: S8 family serine peptidase [Myxococcota bacterium]